MVTPTRSTCRSAEKLNELTPGDHEKRTALFNSGAEAVENAVKVARHFTGRAAVVAFDHAYHGRTNLTMALTAKNMPYKHRFGPFAERALPRADGLPLPLAGRRRSTAPRRPSAYVTDQIHAQVGEENRAAVIIEPIQGEGGFIVPPRGFLPALARLVPRQRHPVHRRRGAERLLPHRRLVRLRRTRASSPT